MKGCFVLQRRFAYVGHELAVHLKEQGIINSACAYVHERDSYDFLRDQKILPYSALILDEDIQKHYSSETVDMEYLSEFEREFGNLWSFIEIDRVIRLGQFVREYPHDRSPYSHDELLKIVQSYARSLVAFVDAEKPDFLFTYQPGALGTLMLYVIAKKRRIPIITMILPVTRNRVLFSERYDRLTWVEKLYERYRDMPCEAIPSYEVARQFLEEFKERPVVYSRVYASLIKHGKWRQFDFLLPSRLRSSVRTLYILISNWLKKKEKRTDYTTIHPLLYLLDRAKRVARNIRGADDLYDIYEPETSFAFYALHFEPELSMLLLAPFDTDQIAIVKRLARSLPAGMLLYVKEHPQMTPYRPRRYYKELKKIPNVRLLRPELSSFDIMTKAKLVSTITGAAGWEAAMFGKPVITFGSVFYNALPSVAYSRVPDELPALVERQLASDISSDDVVRYLAALFEDSAECDLLHVWEFETDETKKKEMLAGVAALLGTKLKAAIGNSTKTKYAHTHSHVES